MSFEVKRRFRIIFAVSSFEMNSAADIKQKTKNILESLGNDYCNIP